MPASVVHPGNTPGSGDCMDNTKLCIAVHVLAFAAFAGAHAAEMAGPSRADYEAAAALLPGNVQGLVKNETVVPHWNVAAHQFWYKRDGATGPEYVIVDTRTGAKSIAGPDIDKSAAAPATARPDASLLVSPDGKRVAFARNDNLFVRDLASGAETQLTTDGAPYYSWAKMPDGSLMTVVLRKTGMKVPPYNTSWSPDGRYLIAPRIDERKVAVDPFVEWVPQDGSRRPIVHDVKSAFTGDKETLQADYFLFDLQQHRQLPIELPEGYEAGTLDGPVLGWSRARGQVFMPARTFAAKALAIFRLDLASGAVTKVIEETGPTRVETNTDEYKRANLRLLGDGAELVWYSGRSGFGHLYLYDAQTGKLKNAITSGAWQIQDIIAVDEARREIYFTAGGREPGRDPYYRHLYRVDFSGRNLRLLTEPDADHRFDPEASPFLALLMGIPAPPLAIEPRLGVFIDTWSTVSTPPVTVLRSTRDGHVIAELERADASGLYQAGWRAPVRERVKAADGKTDLYAVYYAPHGARDDEKRPVIDAVYGGPQVFVTPRNFHDAYASRNPLGAESLARLGFSVITVDGRGTPGRSNAFRDAGYVNFTQVGIDDHIAAIRELARRHPQIDASRVGVYGWSWGGTFSAQAILSRPEFYRVAVSGAGVYDYAALYSGFDSFTGAPAYADGTRLRGKPDEYPSNWNGLDITHMAGRLTGHLMLVAGDLDENVPPHQAFRLIDALIKANKPYDLLFLPNHTHTTGALDGYTIKRTWDYFVEHLMQRESVLDMAIENKPAKR